MHDAAVVVRNPVIGDRPVVVLSEVVLPARLYILPLYRHPGVAIGGALLMIEAQRVHELVYYRAVPHAARRLEIENLAVADAADGRPASRLRTFYRYVIRVAPLVRAETQTGPVVVILDRAFDRRDIGLVSSICKRTFNDDKSKLLNNTN